MTLRDIWASFDFQEGQDIMRTQVNEATYQPLSSPDSKCEQSQLFTHLHPPAIPFLVLSFNGGTDIRARSCAARSKFIDVTVLRSNLLIPQVYVLKSSSDTWTGICPVNARPIAIRDAACVQIKIALFFCEGSSP